MTETREISSDILRGHTDTVVLGALLDRDRYGYEIYNAILDRTEGVFELKETTLYSSYKRLEREGHLSSYWGDETQGARRKYYAITAAGRELFEQNKRDWEFTRQILDTLILAKDAKGENYGQ
ncbi:MAG: PadR family transcriptional regulator [Spirochaetaceae bacterium]|jgi:DNA-binding PadR family transcriptional regulator|nr:PadR family transcriptional regulator [Spirochaetaceae bacterium]